jgi:hypothetical protein
MFSTSWSTKMYVQAPGELVDLVRCFQDAFEHNPGLGGHAAHLHVMRVHRLAF